MTNRERALKFVTRLRAHDDLADLEKAFVEAYEQGRRDGHGEGYYAGYKRGTAVASQVRQASLFEAAEAVPCAHCKEAIFTLAREKP